MQRDALLGAERLPMGARLDHLAQPDPLLVGRDVLDLVGDRAAVGRLQVRERVGQRLAGDVHPQQLGGDGGHHLRRQPQRLGVERRVTGRLAAERVEACREMSKGPIRADQRNRRGDRPQVLRGAERGADRRCADRGGRGLGDRGSRSGSRTERTKGVLVEPVVAAQQAVDRGAGRRPIRRPG